MITGIFTVAMAGAEGEKALLLPAESGASIYFGQMYHIDSKYQEGKAFNPTVTIPTTSLWMVQQAQYKERLKLKLAIAGTFWYPFPEDPEVGYTSFRTGGVAIWEAKGTYSFGDLERPWLQISVGQQDYKYNPYAKNFGEYLFRSEAYPNTVRTGDWGAIDMAKAGIWGMAFKGSFLEGMIQNDFLITLANERAPLNDVSLTNILSLNLGKVFQIGGGLMLSRYIPIDSKKSKPKNPVTGWFTWTAADQKLLQDSIKTQLALDPNYLIGNTNFVDAPGGTKLDTALVVGKNYWAASTRPLVGYILGSKSPVPVSVDYIDTKTMLLMGRASFDIKPLIGLGDILGPSDLVLYGEVGVLGTNNYPIYYTKMTDRMPRMIGFYFPTFRFLDYITVEAEYFTNPYINSDYTVALFRAPQPRLLQGSSGIDPAISDPLNDHPATTSYNGDNFKWTITVSKTMGPVNIAGQYGKDHYRPLNSGFRPSYTEAMTTPNSKYFMLKLMTYF